MKNTKMVKMTKRAMMTEAHRRAKTYEGHYDACFKLAMVELNRELTEMNVTAEIERLQGSNVDKSNVSDSTIQIVNDYLNYIFKNGKRRFSIEKVAELNSLIFDGSDDKGTIANVLFHAPKGFKSIAKKHTKDDVFFDADDVYMSAIEKMMQRVNDGKEIVNLSQSFTFEVLNIVKKENNRLKDKHADSRKNGQRKYASMDSENFKEVDLYSNKETEYMNRIPVDKIHRDIDMSEIFTAEELQIIEYRMKGLSKVEIDKKFGQRMDRKFLAMQEKSESYIMFGYSEKKVI